MCARASSRLRCALVGSHKRPLIGHGRSSVSRSVSWLRVSSANSASGARSNSSASELAEPSRRAARRPACVAALVRLPDVHVHVEVDSDGKGSSPIPAADLGDFQPGKANFCWLDTARRQADLKERPSLQAGRAPT